MISAISNIRLRNRRLITKKPNYTEWGRELRASRTFRSNHRTRCICTRYPTIETCEGPKTLSWVLLVKLTATFSRTKFRAPDQGFREMVKESFTKWSLRVTTRARLTHHLSGSDTTTFVSSPPKSKPRSLNASSVIREIWDPELTAKATRDSRTCATLIVRILTLKITDKSI